MTCRAAGAILKALYPRPGVRLPFGDSYRRASQYPPLIVAPKRNVSPDSIAVRTEDGKLLVRSDAVLYTLRRLGGMWRAIAIAMSAVPRGLRDIGTISSRGFVIGYSVEPRPSARSCQRIFARVFRAIRSRHQAPKSQVDGILPKPSIWRESPAATYSRVPARSTVKSQRANSDFS